MDKEVECGVKLRLSTFNTYWQILKRNYKDTQHDDIDFKVYYSILKDYREKDFINATKMVLKYQQFFPRIDEIVKYLPDENLPKWFFEKNESLEMEDQEKQEINNLLKEMIWNQ